MFKNIFKFSSLLFLIVVICVTIVTVVFEITTPILQEREIAAVSNSIDIIYPDNQAVNKLDRELADDEPIKEVYEVTLSNDDLAYAYKTSYIGKNGEVVSVIGISNPGVIDGIEYINFGETPGIGDVVTKDPFMSQFVSKGTDEVNIDLVSGATYSSTAVKKSVEASALDFNENYREA